MKKLSLGLLALLSLNAFAANGIYWVPITANEQAPYAVFGLENVELTRTGDKVLVKYDLPLELTGERNTVELKGTIEKGKRLTLTGTNASGECRLPHNLSTCMIDYKNLVIDTNKRDLLLSMISADHKEKLIREAVAASFCNVGGEPCGFLRVTE